MLMVVTMNRIYHENAIYFAKRVQADLYEDGEGGLDGTIKVDGVEVFADSVESLEAFLVLVEAQRGQ